MANKAGIVSCVARRIALACDLAFCIRPHRLRATVVNMDVERYEIFCLREASRLAPDERPVFLIEIGIEEGQPNSLDAFREFVETHERDIYAMIRRPNGQLKFRKLLEGTAAACWLHRTTK